ncbi:unnamed protein product [Phaedon cochleariae]|uniref:SWIM-type domain-containing protein n=1 Tax=Phaedon cochleariae TaxID=80249 RepID=A0A9P0DH05_PHACE|nr:unnamed protein product [Phaedon cochleariae]
MAVFQYNPNIDFNTVKISKSDIENLLPHWNTKINEVYQYKTKDCFEMNINVAAKTETEVEQWLDEYQEKSKCSYSIRSKDGCSGTKVNLKLRMKCQHNTGNKNVYDPTVRKRTRNRTRNSNCPSIITITLRNVPKRYRGKDKTKAPDPDRPCEIKIIPYHNHSTSSADILRFRQVSKETKEKLVNLFESGYSPFNALESIKMDIQLKYDNYHEILADRSLCPDYMYCYHLYIKIFKEKYRPLGASQEFLNQKIEEFNQDNNMKSAGIKFVDNDYVICLCPPFMQRIHETVEESSDMVFMDSVGTADNDGSRIFVLLTNSECGGLPLAVFMTTSECCHLISIGFQLLKEIMGNRVFHGTIDGPNIFMTEDSAAEQAAIQSEWPKSTHLLSIFHVLKSIWKWLIETKNGIKQDHQHIFYEEFRSIIYAKNEEECTAAFQSALTSSKNYPEYQSYLQMYWAQRNIWALCYRNDTRQGQNTNNISEAAMRLLKEKLFDKIKAFNFIQVVDFMMTRFVCYHEKILLDAAHNQIPGNVLNSLISQPPSSDVIASMQHLGDNIHLVPTDKDPDLFYIVNSEVLICTCTHGRRSQMPGHMCKHIDWICCFVKSDKFIKPIDNERSRRQYLFIATGDQPSLNWPELLLCGKIENIETIDESSMDELEEANQEQFILRGHETLNGMNEIFSQYLQQSPMEASQALDVFYDHLKNIKTVSGFATACHNFSSGTIQRNNSRECRQDQNTAIGRRLSYYGKESGNVILLIENNDRKLEFPQKKCK